MTPYILKRLVIPLVIVGVIMSVILFFMGELDLPGFLLNLVSEIIGIIITVWFVDKVLSEHEAGRWKNVKVKTYWRIEGFIERSLDHLLEIIGLRQGLLVAKNMWRYGEGTRRAFTMTLELDPQLSDIETYLKRLYEKLPTKEQIQSLEQFTDQGYRILETPGSQLDPDVTDHLLKSLESMEITVIDSLHSLPFAQRAYPDPLPPEVDRIVKQSKEVAIGSIAGNFYQTVWDLIRLHNILNPDTEATVTKKM
jgi:hypothetical protein